MNKIYAALLLGLLIVLNLQINAQTNYTLTNGDVEVVDGLLGKCTYGFSKNTSGTILTIPETLDYQTVVCIGNEYKTNVLNDKNIKGLYLPSTVQTIGVLAFRLNDITDLDLSNCNVLTSIGSSAFTECGIESIDFSGCSFLTAIGAYAFVDNSLASLDLSSCTALKSIGEGAFASKNLEGYKLPTHSILGSLGWVDGANVVYDSGDTVTNFWVEYYIPGEGVDYFNISYELDGGINEDFNPTVYLKSNGVDAFVDASKYGYTFDAWYTSEYSTTPIASIPAESTSDKILYARWIADDCNLVFYANSGVGTMDDQVIAFNSSVNLVANEFTKTDSVFTAWNTSADGSGTAYDDEAAFTMTNIGDTLYAQWALACDLVFDANGGVGTMANKIIALDATVNLPANEFTKTDSIFAAWNTLVDGSGIAYDNEAEFTMDIKGDTLYAQWMTSTAITDLSTLKISIYPNPTSGFVTVLNATNGVLIEIYNIAGTLVKQVYATSTTQIINVSELNAGVYVISSNGISERLIVK